VSDSIERIAEEMERVVPDSLDPDESHHYVPTTDVAGWAARLRAIASPEREAFLKAAEEYCEPSEFTTLDADIEKGKRFMAAYRAWKEAQRG